MIRSLENIYSFISSHSKGLRLSVYLIAFIIRFVLAIFFQDSIVFFDTGLDIFVNHSNLYANTTLQSTFNYFPLAYLVTLPQIWLYYLLPFRSSVLLRVMFKLPKISADLVLAWLFSDKFLYNLYQKDITNFKVVNQLSTKFINNYELFILFNPLNIYISAMTNQIDMFPAIFLVLSWYAYKKDKYLFSGMSVMIAFLIKEYAVFLMIILFFATLKRSFKFLKRFIIGNLIVFIPTVGIVSIINFRGFIDHAILYQLFRKPIGSSISAFVYEIGTYILPSTMDRIFQTLVSLSSFSIILLVFLFGCYKVYMAPTEKNIILYSTLSFLAFCIFNKVFWPQYLVSLFALWLLYRIENQKPFNNEFIYWVISITPIFLLYRSGELATQALVYILGLDFYIDLIIMFFALHIIIILFLVKMKQINIKNNRFIIGYFIIMIFIISQIYFQLYLIHLPTYTLQKMP